MMASPSATEALDQGHPRAGFPPASLSLLPQLRVPMFLELPTGSEGCLEDCGTCGGDELREETPWRGAIPVGARGGFGVNQEIAGGLSVFSACLTDRKRVRAMQKKNFGVRGMDEYGVRGTDEYGVRETDGLCPRNGRVVSANGQLFDFFLVERQLDLSSVTARLRGCSCVVLSGLDIGLISQ
ncbi:hypothetical protein Taro_006109 [Colocasia esculenta]|uniref:Uncharacterized protein n=1 Tax=Colocasia esculenta TaxID=4460 RepID=A0A843TWG0_COLES|nr:hypothetical protein [Colocasia esculenta]